MDFLLTKDEQDKKADHNTYFNYRLIATATGMDGQPVKILGSNERINKSAVMNLLINLNQQIATLTQQRDLMNSVLENINKNITVDAEQQG